jgi:Protein of unknown function (DUF4446)
MDALSIVALVVAVVAVVLAVLALRAARSGAGSTAAAPGETPRPAAPPPSPRSDVARLRDDVKTLRLDLADALRHLAVVRYDAFGTMGGHMSWSMALLDDNGNGVVLTSINGRSESRSYAKNVREFSSDAKLSPEEAEAIQFLKKESAG